MKPFSSMPMTKGVCATASCARSCTTAPKAASGSALACVRFHTCTSKPASHKRLAMGRPIFPVPSRAMRVCWGVTVMVVRFEKGAGYHWCSDGAGRCEVCGPIFSLPLWGRAGVGASRSTAVALRVPPPQPPRGGREFQAFSPNSVSISRRSLHASVPVSMATSSQHRL